MKKVTITFIIVICLICQDSFAQTFFKNTDIVVSFARQQQDTRLFEFEIDPFFLLRKKTSKYDYDYNVYLRKEILFSAFFSTFLGGGYAVQNSTFFRPYWQAKFGINTYEFRYINDNYTIHKLIMPIDQVFKFGRNKQFVIGLQALPAFSFYRTISNDLSRWEFKLYGIELNPFIGFTLKNRIIFNLKYRWQNYQLLDDVIFNELLFEDFKDPFLEKTWDNFNPKKWWISVAYSF